MTPHTRPGALVVLGAMLGHRYPAVLPAAARRGLTVFGVDDLNPRNASVDAARRRDPAHPLAGLAEVAWIPDDRPHDVLEQVVTWSHGHDIAAVVAFGEAYVDAAAIVADCLGLRGPGLRASRVCRNKLLQRRYLGQWSPRSRLLPPGGRTEAMAGWDTFPAVVKPVGRMASSGVRRVGDAAELRAAVDRYAPVEPAVVEELVEGPELSVESLVAQGRAVFTAVTGKSTNETGSEHFVEMGHTVPDPRLSPDILAAVLAANAAILQRLAFVDGAAHAEYRIGPSGQVTLMEIAARPAGDSIYALYHLATGVPLEETLLAILLGEAVEHPPPRRVARQVYVPHEPGILRAVHADGLGVPVSGLSDPTWPSVTPLEPDAPATVHVVMVGRPLGTRLRTIQESADRSACFVIDAPTLADLDRIEARCRAAVRVEVEPLPRDQVAAGRLDPVPAG
ncbi:MAG TPA: ATP-grasp domain-containing protein [Micromonosporaceae bacterium]